MKYFLLFGPPGAGKGTQAAHLVKKYNFSHISTGEILRAEIAAGTELGKFADVLISQGNLVPDEVVEKMLACRVSKMADKDGVIFDGFPRTIKQAKDLDAILANGGCKVDAVISLMIPDEVVAERIAGRAAVEGRADDASPVTINNRIKTYHDQTEPLIEFYKKAGCYYEVDGRRSVEEVGKLIDEIIEKI